MDVCDDIAEPKCCPMAGNDVTYRQTNDAIDHPAHYGGADDPYEAIKVIEAWELDFCLGNAVKYISRAGRKDPDKETEDLGKAVWYIERKIRQLEEKE